MDKPSHWVTFLNYIFNPMGWVCPYFTQNWAKTTQHLQHPAKQTQSVAI